MIFIIVFYVSWFIADPSIPEFDVKSYLDKNQSVVIKISLQVGIYKYFFSFTADMLNILTW